MICVVWEQCLKSDPFYDMLAPSLTMLQLLTNYLSVITVKICAEISHHYTRGRDSTGTRKLNVDGESIGLVE